MATVIPLVGFLVVVTGHTVLDAELRTGERRRHVVHRVAVQRPDVIHRRLSAGMVVPGFKRFHIPVPRLLARTRRKCSESTEADRTVRGFTGEL